MPSVRTSGWMTLCILSACLLMAVAGCGNQGSVEISLPDGNTVEPGGSIRIVAELKDQQKVEDGTDVVFRTNVGSFEKYSEDVTIPVYEIEVPSVNSQAEATLYGFPGEAGQATVSASFDALSGQSVRDSVTVTVEGGLKPNGSRFSASCEANNVTVYGDVQDRNAMQIRCELRASDIAGNPVVKTGIQWMVENGCAVRRIQDPGNQDLVVALSPDCDPQDVEPTTGEPSHMEDGIVHNPRDGLLTLVFYTQGEEGYLDSNGNAKYDATESFAGYDLPEPYVDENDNLQYDEGEQFIDGNNDGQWTPANGRWDADTMIWASTKVMFTGTPHLSPDTSRIEPLNIDVPNGDTQQFFLYVMDINHNPLASQPVGDEEGVDVYVEGADLFTTDTIYLYDSMGVEFNPDGSIKASSFGEDRTYEIVLSDPDPEQDQNENALLRTSVRWVAARPFNDYDPMSYEYGLLQIEGKCH